MKLFPSRAISITLLFIIIFGCQKDFEQFSTNEISSDVYFNWSDKEKKFFSLYPDNSQNVNSRSEKNYIYQDLLMEAYHKIAFDNEVHNFVDDVVDRVGYPLWEKSLMYSNDLTGEDFVIIPLTYIGDNEINSLITLYRKPEVKDGDFVINTINRSVLKDTSTVNKRQNLAYSKLLMQLDKLLFNKHDAQLNECVCYYTYIIENETSVASPPPPVECEWHLFEIYYEHGNWYIVGTPTIPPHLDHDRDGIPNDIDQDFLDRKRRLGSQFTQESWENSVLHWWSENYESEYGNYYSFWEDYYDDPTGGTQFNWDEIQDMWESFWDFFDGFFEDIGNWWDDFWNDHDPWDCYDWPLSKQSSTDRSGITLEMWVLICGGEENWWEGFVPPPNANPDVCNMQGVDWYDTYEKKIYCHWTKYYAYSDPDFDLFYRTFYTLDCDPLNPNFGDCVDNYFAEGFYNAPPEIYINDVKELFDNCFGSDLDPSAVYTVTLYIDQPEPGTRTLYKYYPDPTSYGRKITDSGHTFLGVTKVDNQSATTITFGFYPLVTPTGQQTVPGGFYHENTDTEYNISITYEVTVDQIESMRNYFGLWGNIYRVQDANCTSVMLSALREAGIQIIDNTRRYQWPFGWIEENPGDFGEDMRNNHPGGVFSDFGNPTTPPLSTCH